MSWASSRVAVIYVIVLIFCFTCVDFKALNMRIKIRHLNDAIPDFSDMILYSRNQSNKKELDWKPYEKYFQLIMRYMPDDVLTQQLLGMVEYSRGNEQEAIKLFKDSSLINGQVLFWPNYNLGILYYKKKMWPQAAEYFLKAAASNPKLSIILMMDSMVYRQIFTSPYFRYSLNNEILDAQSHAYILLLSSLYHLKQYDKMLVIANAALSNPDLSYKDAFYYHMGLAFAGMGQWEKAFLLFQRSLSIEKNNPDVYFYMANIFQNTGQLQQAKSFLQASYILYQKNDPRFPYESQVNLRFF